MLRGTVNVNKRLSKELQKTAPEPFETSPKHRKGAVGRYLGSGNQENLICLRCPGWKQWF